MPQIEQLAETLSSQVFWLLVFFALVYFIVGRSMVPKVMGTVATRDKQIADDLAAAQAARDQADANEEAWRVRENENRAKAQDLIAAAKDEAARASQARLSEAQGRIDAQLAEAEQRIDASRRDALAEVEGVAAEATQDIVARVAGLKVTKPSANSAVKKVMAHV
jgi:F-type H+-transporting ATPase subunit b